MIGFDVESEIEKGLAFGGAVDMWEGRRQASYPDIHSPFALRFSLGQAADFDRLKMVLKSTERAAFMRSAA